VGAVPKECVDSIASAVVLCNVSFLKRRLSIDSSIIALHPIMPVGLASASDPRLPGFEVRDGST
jgi:hypothetical protein